MRKIHLHHRQRAVLAVDQQVQVGARFGLGPLAEARHAPKILCEPRAQPCHRSKLAGRPELVAKRLRPRSLVQNVAVPFSAHKAKLAELHWREVGENVHQRFVRKIVDMRRVRFVFVALTVLFVLFVLFV